MVMTDGVADDYFPNDPGLHRLFEDLLAHRVVTSSTSAGEKIRSGIGVIPPVHSSGPDPVGVGDPLKVGVERPRCASEAPPINSPGALPGHDPALGRDRGGFPPEEERLRSWLDSLYSQVRGSV